MTNLPLQEIVEVETDTVEGEEHHLLNMLSLEHDKWRNARVRTNCCSSLFSSALTVLQPGNTSIVAGTAGSSIAAFPIGEDTLFSLLPEAVTGSNSLPIHW